MTFPSNEWAFYKRKKLALVESSPPTVDGRADVVHLCSLKNMNPIKPDRSLHTHVIEIILGMTSF